MKYTTAAWKVFSILFLIICEYCLYKVNKMEAWNIVLKEQAQVTSYSPYGMIIPWLLIF